MDLTHHQLYALFAMSIGVIIVIGIAYMSGLRTGRRAGYLDGENFASQSYRRDLYALRRQEEELSARLASATKIATAATDEAQQLRQALQFQLPISARHAARIDSQQPGSPEGQTLQQESAQ